MHDGSKIIEMNLGARLCLSRLILVRHCTQLIGNAAWYPILGQILQKFADVPPAQAKARAEIHLDDFRSIMHGMGQ